LAEYAAHLDEFRAAGADVVAVSVDDAGRSEPVRERLGLGFAVLCDTRREVVRGWGIYNPKEHGGIAVPSVFVVGRDRRVRYRSIDRTAARVRTDGILAFLRAGTAPRRAVVWARLGDFVQAIRNTLARGGRTPEA
jgi:peroxiredoxin